mmetsp:Transcript_33607/g.90965  ORF Transcript_33607/g.90965 Transcript_33607/m.90965 type:complete len:296 (-) Transcript_33607:113-1000(-)
MRSAAEELGNLGHARERDRREAAAPRARRDRVRGALLGEEPTEFTLVAIPWKACNNDPVVEGMAIHAQVLALGTVVAHTWPRKAQGEAAQDGPGEAVRLEEDHLLRLQHGALTVVALRNVWDAEGDLVAARESDLATVHALQGRLAITVGTHELLAHNGPRIVPILVGAGTLLRWRVQHDAAVLPQAPHVCSLWVALHAQTDLEAHDVLLCNPQSGVDLCNMLPTAVAHLVCSSGVSCVLHLSLRHVNVTAICCKSLGTCDEAKSTAVVVRFHHAKVNSVRYGLAGGLFTTCRTH